MIELSSVSYRYPGTETDALRSIGLSVEPDEFLLLNGISGSGKSTLLRVINGLVPHFFGGVFRGQALVGEMNTRYSSPAKLSVLVGTVFQEPGNRFLTSSVEDELAFGLELSGLPGREIQGRVNSMVDRFNLGPLIDRKLDQLSAGEQQRVAVAAALGRLPQILLLDEPTSQLDPIASQAIFDWLVEVKAQHGLTTIVSEHRIDRMMDVVDRIAYLSGEGALKFHGSLEDVIPNIALAPSPYSAMRKLGIPVSLHSGRLAELSERLAQIKQPELKLTSKIAPALSSMGLSHNYNGIPALKGVDLELYPGEIAALVGENGAGKSTLLRCLIGLLEPDQGEIFIKGKRMSGRPVSEVAGKVAYVPQWPSALLFSETVEEELHFTLNNHGLDEDPPLDPEELLVEFQLDTLRHRYPRDLSAGQRQRVALASVLIAKPEIILLDEPTLGMDSLAQAKLSSLLQTWSDQGAAVLIATHDVEYAAAYAQRVILLEKGELVADGPTSETLFSRPHLRTSLQRITGRAWPASPEQIPNGQGVANAHY